MIYLMGMIMSAYATGSIEVVVQGLRNDKGSVAASLYEERNKTGFPGSGEQALRVKRVDLDSDRCSFVFEDLPPGNYAIAIFHDEDNDGKVKMALGIPREGFGFSSNPTIYFGPPGFDKAAQRLESGRLRAEIQMKYLL